MLCCCLESRELRARLFEGQRVKPIGWDLVEMQGYAASGHPYHVTQIRTTFENDFSVPLQNPYFAFPKGRRTGMTACYRLIREFSLEKTLQELFRLHIIQASKELNPKAGACKGATFGPVAGTQ
jgi:hypothetical protein